jgi:hypothetical protein
MSRSLSVSIVVYRTDLELLADCLAHLARAVEASRCDAPVDVFIVDNGPAHYSVRLAGWITGSGWADPAFAANAAPQPVPSRAGMRLALLTGHGNVGYGAANNLAIERSVAQTHLVLNPDVDVGEDSLRVALDWLDAHPADRLVGARTFNADGAEVPTAKDMPSVLVLALRALNVAALSRWFARQLERYDSAHRVPGADGAREVTHVSGSFMLARTADLRAVGAFDRRYFLYFEDFYLSRRLARLGRVVQPSHLKVWHHGGDAARKGVAHIRMFAVSAARYFSQYGWKLF